MKLKKKYIKVIFNILKLFTLSNILKIVTVY